MDDFGNSAFGAAGSALSAAQSKRRSRYETNGRDFKCQICEKTYLSYPAMYTHMKNKHALDPNGASFL